jgi:hypothetical protein
LRIKIEFQAGLKKTGLKTEKNWFENKTEKNRKTGKPPKPTQVLLKPLVCGSNIDLTGCGCAGASFASLAALLALKILLTH